MPPDEPQKSSPAPVDNSADKQNQPPEPKPDKDVKVPEFELLTEGYDPAKLKKKSDD